ncbi:MAG: type VI secretion system membrane subunit TssM [Azoarcus sp.]|nr:type VI secretion system membrane subunit TssM [Azoarcus sp.]
MISSFLSRIFGWILSRALWVTLGVIALFLLIWYAGPLFAFGEMRPLETVEARCWLIGLILFLFLLRFLLGRWRAGRMNERIAGMLRATLSADPASADESQVDVLRDRFTEALGVLRKARFADTHTTLWGRITRHGRYVYELPWYTIIGAPGVGKTTALLNSGLSFPLAKQIGAAAIRGAGGTRHCDWWFTNEAVFLDTAGRYTTHETDAEADKAEWQGFLSLLKKNRSRQPINGVLVMLAVSDLLELKQEGRQAYAATLRRRLDELRNDLGMSFPVYLLINKCDLLMGFDAYFSALDRAGRAQVWGYTLPLAPSGKYEFDPATLAREFDLLEARINAGLVDALQAEPDLSRRELIHAFPQQFAVLTMIFRDIAPDLLSASRFSDSPFLRGIYFTSATQEGTSFDRIVNALGQGFAVQRPRQAAVAGAGKAYFLQELLSQVVFAEAHIAGSDRRAERRSYAWHVGAYALSAATLCGTVFAWAASYRNNLTYIAEVDQKTTAFAQELANLPQRNDANVNALLPILDMAENLPDSAVFDADRPALRWRFGLYQGGKLKAGATPLYRQLLDKRFKPTVKAAMEQWLRTVDTGDMEFSYEILKAYLMMHDPAHFNEGEFLNFVKALWGQGSETALARHLEALMAMDALLPDTPMDAPLVNATRSRLTQYTTAQRAYHRLTRLLQDNSLPGFSVAGEAGEQAGQVFLLKGGRSLTHGVPSLYTYRGYHELFAPKIGNALNLVGKDEAWVLGTAGNGRNTLQEIASGKLARDVKRQYVADYISHWQRYLDDFGVREPVGLRDAAQILDTLAGVDSPLMRFMQGAARETTLYKEASRQDADKSLLDRARRTANATADDFRRILPAGVNDPMAPADIPEMAVNKHFAALRNFVGGPAGDGVNAPINQAMKRLEDLKMLVADALYRAENKMAMPETALVTQLSTSTGNMPKPIKDIVKTVAASSGRSIKAAKIAVDTNTLQSEVTAFCQKAIESRYPFKRGAAVGVTADDFAEIFGPNGRMERFRQQQGPGTNLPRAFDQARVIKDTFFRGGSSSPRIAFTLKPLKMDQEITILNLNIGGQTIRYDHGPQVSASIAWPRDGGAQIRLSLTPLIQNGVNDVTETGLWALHRLFERYGEIRPGATPDVFNVVLSVGGRMATFEIRPTSVHNPFRLPELNSFRCPQNMR